MRQGIRLILWILVVCSFLGCKDPKVIKKIDQSLRVELAQLKENSQMEKRIAVVFRVNEELTDLHHLVLERESVKIIAHIGDIFTGTVPAKNVYNVAKFRFVEYVQGQRTFRTAPIDSSDFKLKEK